jgi:hypothetical protein
MKTVKMSIATIQGKLSRAEMKNIMAGSGDHCPTTGSCGGSCNGGAGTCGWLGNDCVCNANMA